ncbi:hypothetical protein T190423A01A_50074 [Tenacibaculum sp. 190130A14a]|uniref:Uncharacterized protein n=1 Tax=Tenacibaculum polynesiense TaxID=3137857 RepID=A0ABM9PED0_9FLAO
MLEINGLFHRASFEGRFDFCLVIARYEAILLLRVLDFGRLLHTS